MIPRLWPRPPRCATLCFLIAFLGVSACDKVPLLAPTQSTITLVTNRRILPVSGTAEITATVVEQSGTPVHNGTLVTFTTTLGTVEPREAQTDGGQVRAILYAGQQSGTAVVGAFSGSARAQTLEIQIGAAAVQAIVLSVSPGTVSPVGGSVQLTGVPVTFAASAGILSSSTAVTDENGDARVTLTTSRETTVSANAGSKQATATIRVNTAPTVTVSATTQSPTALQPVSFAVNVTAGSSPIRAVTLDFGDGSSQALGALTGNSSVSHTYRAGGAYTVTAAVLDSSGERTSVSTVVDVRPPTPINVTLSSTTASPTVGAPVNFDANVTPATVTITRYEWDFGDGQSTVTSGDTTSHIYTSAGRKTVSVTAVSSDGLTGGARLEINVAPEPPINVTISFSPTPPTANTTVTFTATVTPTTTQVVRYEWVFGDGSTAVTSGQIVHHVYATAGVKQVSVRVVAADGRTASAVAEIRVN